jgi:hypothetical protein
MAAGADEVIQLGELNDEGVPVVFVKRAAFKVILDKGGFEGAIRLFLRNWLEPGVTEKNRGE